MKKKRAVFRVNLIDNIILKSSYIFWIQGDRMMSKLAQYALLCFVVISSAFVNAQNLSSEENISINKYFSDSILLNYREWKDTQLENVETIFVKYYKGLDLIDEVEDSLKFIFYEKYSIAMGYSKLYDESNKLAKKGIQLSKVVDNMPEGLELGYYYNQLAFNYLDLHEYDSVTWAYKKNIERNKLYESTWLNVSGYNNLGYHYFLNVKKNDSALYYLNKLDEIPQRDLAFSTSLTLEWSIKDNKALVYVDQGRYAEAGALFKEVYEHYGNSKKGYLWRERWLRAGLQYVDVELKLGNLVVARNALKEIEDHFYSIPDFHTAPLEYYPSKLLLLKIKRHYARAIGNFKESDLLGEAYIELQDNQNLTDQNKLLGDLNLIREIGLYNAQNAIEKEKAFSIIEKKNLALDLNSKSVKTYWSISIVALLVIIAVGYFYFRKMRKYDERKNIMQAEYSQNLIKTQEEERHRLARDLHDSVGQKLMLLTKSGKKIGNADVEQLAGSTLEEVRHISRGLYPPNLQSLGLTMAINTLIYDINTSTDLFFTDEIENIDLSLSKDSKLHLFRIIQETLSNIVKHSEAKAVKISVRKSVDDISIYISDNGKGFNLESAAIKKSLGMKTLFERAKILNAKLNLKSEPGKGSSMTLNIPINNG